MRSNVLRGWAVAVLLAVPGLVSGAEHAIADAAKRQDKTALRALLKQRAAVDAPQPDGATALHWAAHWDDLEAADLLLSAGANVNAKNDYAVTPLSLAATNGSANMAQRGNTHEALTGRVTRLGQGETPSLAPFPRRCYPAPSAPHRRGRPPARPRRGSGLGQRRRLAARGASRDVAEHE